MPEYRRRLPHFQPDNAYLFLTWRLWGSRPLKLDSTLFPTSGHAFAATDHALHRDCLGPTWLRQPQIADLLAQAILIGDHQRRFYELRAWVVMPNHVHVRILPLVSPSVLTRWWKGSTAREANRVLGRTGQRFWQDESFDHYLRHSNQISQTVTYIEQNPVSAGLARSAELWPWSSAGWPAKPPAPPRLSAPPS